MSILAVTRGDTVNLRAVFTDLGDPPVDLGAATTKLRFTVKRNPADSDDQALISISSEDGRFTITGTTTLDWTIRPDEYELMGAIKQLTKFVHDLQITDEATDPPRVYTIPESGSAAFIVHPDVRQGTP